jgi:hypothetical protein
MKSKDQKATEEDVKSALNDSPVAYSNEVIQ